MFHSNHWCSWSVLDKYRDLKSSGWYKWIRYFLLHLESTKAFLEEDANVTNISQTVILQHRWTRNHSSPRVMYWIQALMITQNLTDCSDLQSSEAWKAGSHLWEKNSGVSIYPWPDMLSNISLAPPQHSRNEHMMRWVCLPQSGRHHIGILFHSNKTGIFCYTEAWVPVKRKTAQKVIGLEEVEGTMSHVPMQMLTALWSCSNAVTWVKGSHPLCWLSFRNGSPQGYIFHPHSTTNLCEYHLFFSERHHLWHLTTWCHLTTPDIK